MKTFFPLENVSRKCRVVATAGSGLAIMRFAWICWVALGLLWASGLRALAAPAPPANFAVEDVLTNLEQPMAIRFLPDGRMLLIQKKGIVRIVDVAATPVQSQIYMNLADPAHANGLDWDQERGVLDLAIDPSFPTSPYIYIFYTPASGPNGPLARIARFTHLANSGGVTSRGNLSSEVILWQDTEGYDSCCHMGGGLDFGPDGRLYLTSGDHFQGSYASNIQIAGGSVHRINKDGSIPADNPFVDGAGPNVDSIFAYGLRNPFRSRWDLTSGRYFIGEVGGNTQSTAWEDLHVIGYNATSGRFIDADIGTASDNFRFDGINFGWPTVEGLPPHTAFPGAIIDAAVGEPIFAYKHSGGTAAITGGVVYRGSQFPSSYQGTYFYADSTRDFVRYLKFAANGSLIPNPSPSPISSKNPDTTSYPFDLTPLGRIVSLEVGPGGALYYVSFTDSGGAYGEPDPAVLGAVRRYVYDNGNARPVIAEFSATPASGPSPLAVSFRIRASDPENNAMTYIVRFGDGTTTGAAQPLAGNTLVTVPRTYSANGIYQATLEVMDATHTTVQTTSILVGRPPVISSLASSNSRPGSAANMFRYGDVISFSATASDPDGVLTGANYSWAISFVRPGNTHPAFGPQSGTTSINFPIPSQGQGFSGPVYYRCFLTVTDANGLSASSSIDIFPEKSNITFDTVPSGIEVQIDGNTSRVTPFVLDTLINFDHLITVPTTQCVNGTHHDFVDWSNGPTTAQQLYNVPVTDSSLTAHYAADGPCTEPPSAGLVMHLKGGAGVVVSGSNVLTWEDQTTSFNDLSAVGGPVLVSGGPNNQPMVRFDGVDDALARSGFTGLPVGGADRSVLMVVRYNAANSSNGGWAGFSYGTAANNQTFGLALTPAGNLGVQGWGSGNDFQSNPTTTGVGPWLTQTAIYSGGTLTQFKDGTAIGTASHAFDTGTAGVRLGQELNGGKNLNMDVAEVLVYNRAVSVTERQQIEGYFGQRYAIGSGGGGNTAPVVGITAPASGAVFTSGTAVGFSATATDAQQGNLGAGISWSSNLSGLIGTGASISISSLAVGTHTVTASVTDSGGLVGSASVTVTIVSAGSGGLITSGLVVQLESDLNVALQTGTTVAAWLDQSGLGNDMVASGAPQWGTFLTPSGLPAVSFNGSADKLERIGSLGGLPSGNANRTIIMVAKYKGSTAWAGVSYGTGANNQAFGLYVKHPTGELGLQGWGGGNDLTSATAGIGAGWLVQSGVLNNGTATLYKDGTQIAQWAHTYATGLSKMVIGAEIQNLGYVNEEVAAVLIYNRALSAAELTGVQSYLQTKYLLAGTANTAPVLAITAPANGASFTSGTAVTFTGTANDTQQGNLSAGITWSSSINGAIGTGASISVSTLSVGTHTITASRTDSGGLTGSATRSVTITAPANTAPVVTITAPANGASFTSGTAVTFTGTANDTQQGNLSAGITWSSSINGAIGTGASISVSTLSVGTHTITASRTDSGGLTGSATRSVTITAPANTAPVVTITAPANGASFTSGTAVTFTGTANDTQQGNMGTALTWSSSINGPIGTGASISVSSLSVGTHTITASVTDNGGLTGSATRSVTITAPANTAPVVAITAPANGASFTSGTAVTFTGTATDTQQGNLSTGITWSSSINGSIGTGASISVSSLSVGTHTITASRTDSGGLTGTATRSVTITAPANTAPVVAITAPANGASFTSGTAVTFTGTATDTQQGNLSAGLTWSSSINGAIGTGASISVSSLSVGTHTITASRTDNGGLTGTATRSVTITANTAPVVTITAPANGASFTSGTSVTFTGTANDTQQGNLSAGLTWSSSINGAIGTGASISVSSLSVGTHTITASRTDSGGLTGAATRSVTITAPGNTAPVVTITAPANGASFTIGTAVTFTGTANDAQQGNLSAGLTWSSSINGAIGTGASISVSSLSVGTHTITASRTDSGGLTGSATRSVTISATSLPVTTNLVLHLESTQGVTTSGTNVSSWVDSSSRGNTVSALGNPQLVPARTPAGRPAITLNGAGDALQRIHSTAPLGGLPVGNANRTIIMVAKYNSSTAWAGVAYGTGANNQAFGLNVKHPTGELDLQGWGSGNDLVSTTAGIGAGWLVQSGVLNNGTATLYKDSTQIAQWAHAYGTVLTKLVIGAEIQNLGYVNMEVAAVLIYDRALTAAERASVETYLRGKYL